jgi:hypothetical protein
VTQAIPHSASYLRDLHDEFGSLGLAAAAYNAGPERVAGWMDGNRTLPAETRDFVLSITGAAADEWKEGHYSDVKLMAEPVDPFEIECLKLTTIAMTRASEERTDQVVARRSARFPPLVACESGRLCRVSSRR